MFSLYDKFSPCIIKFLNTTIYTGWMENHTHTHTSIVKFFMTKQLFWLQKISLNSTLVLESWPPAPGLQRRTTIPHGSWCSHWLNTKSNPFIHALKRLKFKIHCWYIVEDCTSHILMMIRFLLTIGQLLSVSFTISLFSIKHS